MKIGILSDTHDNYQNIDQAFSIFVNHHIGLAFHAGDWTTPDVVSYVNDLAGYHQIKVIGIIGNNDKLIETELLKRSVSWPHVFIPLADYVMTIIDGRTVALYHGHNHDKLADLLESNFNVVIKGHTHVSEQRTINNTVVINPGSTSFSIPRRAKEPSEVVVIDLKSMVPNFIQL